jgi:hypothetical protein
MALKALNTVGGLSVGESVIEVVSANGDVTAANLNVNGLSNLGSVSNITILGGNASSVLTTDGNGVLSWGEGGGNSAAPMPYYIPDGKQYTVPVNFQGLFSKPIEIDGTFEVDGVLIELSNVGAGNSQVIFESGGDYIGHTGFTFDQLSSNLSLPGNLNVTGNILPNGNITYDLGTSTNRWKDIWLANSTIYLGNGIISTDANGNVVITNGQGGQFEVAGNTVSSSTQLANATTTLDVWSDAVRMIFGGANIVVVDSSSATIYGNLNTYGNIATFGNISATGIKTDNLYYANGQPFDFSTPGGSNNTVQYNSNGSFGGSTNFTFTPSTNVLAVTGNITSSNTITTANLLANNTITAANLVANSTVTIGPGSISTSGNMAGIFNATISDINIGLAANVTLGSTSGQVTVRNTLTASNVTVTGTVDTSDLKANDFYSKRSPVTVTSGTVVDTFSASAFRSVKYTIKAGSDLGYQALEVLLVHDGINSIITVYGSLSTAGVDLITLASTIVSGNVQLLATAVGANTTVNLMGTYVPD